MDTGYWPLLAAGSLQIDEMCASVLKKGDRDA